MRKTLTLLSLAFAILALAAPSLAAEQPAVSLDQLFASDGAACTAVNVETVEVEKGAPDLGAIFRTGIELSGNCNEATCSADEFCCNFSCSVCAPRGGYCLDIYCPPTS